MSRLTAKSGGKETREHKGNVLVRKGEQCVGEFSALWDCNMYTAFK